MKKPATPESGKRKTDEMGISRRKSGGRTRGHLALGAKKEGDLGRGDIRLSIEVKGAPLLSRNTHFPRLVGERKRESFLGPHHGRGALKPPGKEASILEKEKNHR